MQGGTEDPDERAMTSHTVMREGCEVTSVEEGHDVERVTVRSDVVKETKSVGEACWKQSARCKQFAKQGTRQRPVHPGTEGEIPAGQTCGHRHDQVPGESKHKVSIEYVQ